MGPTDTEVREALGHLAQTVETRIKSGLQDEIVVRLAPQDLRDAVVALKGRLGMAHLSAITGEDLGPRLRLMYHFWHGRGVTVEAELATDAPTVASIVDIVPGATLYEREGEFDAALERVIRLHEKDPEDVSVNNYYGYLLAEKGEELDLAEELVRKALRAEPENGYFLDSLGWILFRNGDFEGAISLLLEATGFVADDAVIWDHLGQAYEVTGEMAKAAEAYRRSLSLEPENEQVSGRLGKIEAKADPEK